MDSPAIKHMAIFHAIFHANFQGKNPWKILLGIQWDDSLLGNNWLITTVSKSPFSRAILSN